MDTYIAVDIGGTQLRAGLFAAGEEKPLAQKRIPTRNKDKSAIDRLIELLKSIWPANHTVKAIAMAAPGPTNPRTGVVYSAPNIPGWTNLPITQIIREKFDVPIALGNDANMAALGEWKFGAGRGYNHLMYITISTGIGGGVIDDGRLLLGHQGLAGEIGHTTVMHNGPVCSCGIKGHLEALSSGTAIAHYVAEQLASGVPSILADIASPTARDVSQAAENGDPLAIAALSRAGTFMGHALANFLHIYNPQIIILGGGVSHSGAHFMEPVRTSVAERVMSQEYLHGLVITTAALGDDAGLMGASVLAQSLDANS